MNILILEDSSERIKRFNDHWKKYRLTICKNIDQFKSALKYDTYDMICLDHDLEEDEFVSTETENSGTGAVNLMIQKNWSQKLLITPIVIHSLNYPAALSMLCKLKGAGFENVTLRKFTELF